jgi:glycosyltransferase involved in cell wall biosynthesis
MIDIAMLTPFFTGKLGGPYNVIMELAPLFEKRGIRTSVYTTSSIRKFGRSRTEFYDEKNENFHIYRFDSYVRFKEYRISFGLLPYLLKNEKRIDIVHSHSLRSFQEDAGTLVSLLKKKPLVITPHGGFSINWDYGDKIPKMISDKSMGLLKTYLKPHYIAVTRMEIPIIKKYGVDDDHVHFIPHGVNTEIFNPMNVDQMKEKYNLENLDVLLYVGRIAKGKGVDKLIKILDHVVKAKPKTKLIIVGNDAGYLSTVKSLIQKYDLSKHVIFPGYISKTNLAKYYSLADLVIYPSRQEIFGLVILEAMACGKPVIGSDIMGPSEIIVDGKTGFTSNFEDIEKDSNLIIELLNDKPFLKKLGQNGLQRVKEIYTWEKAAEAHFKLYKQVLSHHTIT